MGKAVLISYERNGCEMYYEEKTAEKPEKWPANAREQILDTLCECVEEFKKNLRKIRLIRQEKSFCL